MFRGSENIDGFVALKNIDDSVVFETIRDETDGFSSLEDEADGEVRGAGDFVAFKGTEVLKIIKDDELRNSKGFVAFE